MNKLTFDRLRLSIPNEFVEIIDNSVFTSTISGEGIIKRTLFEQTSPFFYRILTEYGKNTTTVEFNGKSLLDDYPSLINHTNISKCFENINKQRVCYIDYEQALQTAYVLQCDVTCDVSSEHTVQELYNKINLSSSKKWCIRDVTCNRFTIESTVTTKRIKSRMVIYDKEEEMNRKSNYAFLNSVSNPDIQLTYFKEKLRFELNLNSIDRIRHFFKFEQTKLTDLLYSTADPIGQFLHEALTCNNPLSTAIDKSRNLRDLEHLLLLAVCGFDLKNVELVIRDMYGSSRSIKRAKEAYCTLLTQVKVKTPYPLCDPDFNEIRGRLQCMLAKAFEINDSSSANLTNIYYSQNSNQNQEGVVNSFQSQAQVYDPIDIFNVPYVSVPCLPE